jgi:DNA-binding transcriptional LysR family regulator
MLDRFTGLQIFARVAALGSFSAAARALGMSQTMITRHVDAIEDRLGARLFHRTTRRLTLTEAGQSYLRAAERILGELEEAEGLASASVTEPRGTLRLNLPLAFGIREVMPAIADFAALHPGLTVDVGLTDRFIDLVDEGWDLAIRIGQLKDSALVARRLAPIRTALCASPDYIARHGMPRTDADLAAHNCLGYTLPTPASADRWRFGRNGEREVAVSGTIRANNGDALRTAAVAGIGIVYQPTFILSDELRSGLLVPITLDLPPFQFAAAYAVYPPARHVPVKVRRFIDFLAERWAGVPPWDVGLPPALLDPA